MGLAKNPILAFVLVNVLVVLLVIWGASALAAPAMVTTDMPSYNPWDTVHITINDTSNLTARVIDPIGGQTPLNLTPTSSGYTADYSVEQGVVLGTYMVSVEGDITDAAQFQIRTLSILPNFQQEYPLDNITLPGAVLDAGSKGAVNASLNIVIDNETFDISAPEGLFSFNYTATTTGQKNVTITAKDNENITGTTIAGFEVYSILSGNLTISTSQEEYEAGQKVDISVSSTFGVPDVWVTDPLGNPIPVDVTEKKGVFSGIFKLDRQIILGDYWAEAETENPANHVKVAFNVTAPVELLAASRDAGVEFSTKPPTIKGPSGQEVNSEVMIKGTGEGKGFKISVQPRDHPVKEVAFHDLDLPDGHALSIGLDDVPEFGDFVEVYAIDPTELNFTSATVTVTAKGTTLYKCEDWNFTSRECYGDWALFKTGLVPGQNYTFLLTPDDPGYAETNFTDSTNNKAFEYGGETIRPPATSVTGTPALSGDYTALSISDNSRWLTSYIGAGNRYVWQRFVFKINQSEEDITQLNISYEGYGNSEFGGSMGYGVTLYLLNDTSSSWTSVGDHTSSSDNWINQSYAETSDIQSMINSSGYLTLLILNTYSVNQDDDWSNIYTDYVGIDLTFNDTSGPVINIPVIPDTQVINNPVNITANITDDIGVNTAYINITLPNATSIGNLSMTKNGGDIWYYNYTPSIEGLYEFTIYANDSSDNWASSTGNFRFDATLPLIDFVPPTPDNNENISNTYATVNVSVSDTASPNNLTGFIDWNRSLVGWWRFNNETGENTTFFRDWSTYANNATCSNCPPYATGKFGKALQFTGTNGSVQVQNSPSLNITTQLTLEAWSNPSRTSSTENIRGITDKTGIGSFTAQSSWTFYDTTAQNSSSKGFQGAAFDGRYVYFVPFNSDPGVYSGQVTRFDTTGSFASQSSWAFYNTTAQNSSSKGFFGVVFDGRYVYFVPFNSGTGVYSGQVTRFDTTGSFTAQSSWTFYNTTAQNSSSKGFFGAVFDGRYVYFVPNYNGVPFGQVTRFDTTGSFASQSSWTFYNTTAQNSSSGRFEGAVFDGRYIYFVPNINGGYSGQITRFDTTGSFTAQSSWTFYDTATQNLSSRGFEGAVFDGRYIYFVPYKSGTGVYSGQVTRFDTTGSFTAQSSWTFYDTTAQNSSSKGFFGAVFDGRYVYFVPYNSGTDVYSGQVTRFDTTGSFTAQSSWTFYNTTAQNLSSKGFFGAVFDGRYVYFVPFNSGTGVYSGQVTRFDTTGPNASYSLDYGLGQNSFGSTPVGYGARLTTSNGYYKAFENTQRSSGWHHITATYNGTMLSLYVDAVLAANITASGAINTTSANILIGSALNSNFDGAIDEVRIYNRALSEEEINASYNTGLYRLYHNFTDLQDGTYTYTAYVQDLAGNVNQTETRTLTIVDEPPTVNNIIVIPNPQITNNPVNITANITDDISVNTAYINITLPNSTSTGNLSMTKNGGDIWYYNYTPPIEGLYEFTIYANDSSDNWASSTGNFRFDATLPLIDFVPPTPDNNENISNTYATVNVSVSDTASPNNLTGFIDWNRSLVGWWRFNNETGENSTFFRDWSSYGNNGTCIGSNCPTLAAGKFGNALLFKFKDGSSPYMTLSDASKANITGNAISISGWINRNDYNTSFHRFIVSKQRDNTGYCVFLLNNTVTLEINSNSSSWATSSTVINPDQWYFFTGVYNGSHTAMYINGNLENTQPYTYPINSSNITLNIGSWDDGGYSFDGTIDDVRIFNRILSPEEIKASYNSGIYPLYHNFTNLTEGNYTYTAYVQDLAGNINQTETRTLTIVDEPPTVNNIIVIPNPQITNNPVNITANITDDIGVNTAYINIILPNSTSTGNLSMTKNGGDIWYYNYTPPIEGLYNFTIYANDTFDNWATPSTGNFTVDATPPTIIWEDPTPANGSNTSNNWVYLNTTITDASNTSAFFDWNHSLRGYWAMDWYNSSGIYDNSTYNNFGTFYGGLSTSDMTTGKYGSGLEFDGIDDYVGVGNPADGSLNFGTGDFTIEAWVKTHEKNRTYFVSKFHPNSIPPRGYALQITNGKLVSSQSSSVG